MLCLCLQTWLLLRPDQHVQADRHSTGCRIKFMCPLRWNRFLNFREERMTRPERMCRMFPRMLRGGFYPLPEVRISVELFER